ncbi:MAG TPA: porin family protein [Deltaproteobacteria bacterium]|nr:porin family protein [Deltaproteobacteria bacterium]
MKRLIPVLTVLLVLASVTTAMARNTGYGRDWHGRDYRPAETYHDSYVTLKLGVFMPDDDTDFLDTGISIGGALGHNLNRNFALEVGLDYTVADLDETYDYYDEAVDEYDESYVSTLGIPVTARFIVPLSDRTELFAGAGVGVYFTEVEIEGRYYDGYPYSDNDRDTRLGFHALVGADVELMNNAAVTMELKYTELDRDSDDDSGGDFEFGGTTASLGIKLRF